MQRPVVLVTGTSSGIGRESVAHLERAGFQVVATARRQADIERLASPRVDVLGLDVTDAAQRRDAVAEVVARHGRLDALVNNAGFGARLSVEDTNEEVLRRMLETNVVGLQQMCRLVLPHMRGRRSGRIVNVASIAGHVAVPLMGAYCASKFAVRALTQAMHVEVKPFGIHACLVEPGVIRTNFGTHSMAESERAGADLDGPYGPMYRRWAAARDARQGKDASIIARRIVHACASRRPRFHYFAPLADAKAANIAKRLMPDAVLNWGFGRYFGR